MAIVFAVVLLGLFYVFLILPKQRELKRHNALVASLEVGDEVMTGSGMYGTLTEVADDTVLLRVAPSVELKVARRAVAAEIVAPVAPAEPADDIEVEVEDVDAVAGTRADSDTTTDSRTDVDVDATDEVAVDEDADR